MHKKYPGIRLDAGLLYAGVALVRDCNIADLFGLGVF